MGLPERRREIKERHAALEGQRGASSYFKFDPRSPQNRGHMPLSERPVAFVGPDEAAFVGGCIPQVQQALEEFRQKNAEAARGEGAPWQLKDAMAAARTGRLFGEGEARALVFSRLRFNSVLWALADVGVLACATDWPEGE